MKDLFVSVIIPLKEISYYAIFENLPHLDKQTYPHFEVILLPNEHTLYDIALLKKYKWLRIIPTGKITRPAQKRNIGVKESKGDIVSFIDDDAFPTPNWLEETVTAFQEKKVAAVCGPGILPKNSSMWEKVFDEILKTFIGSGGYAYRFIPQSERFVDDYPSMNFSLKKKFFTELGGFNNDYWPGEDSKLCEDLVYKKQQQILYSPEILIYHHRRADLSGYLRQHGQYGYHRGAFFAHGDKNSRRIAYLIPTFFVIYLIMILPLLILKIDIIFIPIFLYIVGMAYVFLKAFINTFNPIIAFASAFVLFLMHIVYGTMFVKGFIRGLTHKDKIYD